MYAFLAILTVCLIMHYQNNSLSVLSFQFFLESYTSAATTGYSYNNVYEHQFKHKVLEFQSQRQLPESADRFMYAL